MTPREFCTSGRFEPMKGGCHALATALFVSFALYNGVAWYFRRERHLKWNAIIYTIAVWWEARKTSHHW